MTNEAIDSNARHEYPMKTHLDNSKNSELAMAAVKAPAGMEHMPTAWRDDETCITRSVTPDGIAISCYENRIPAFVETALEERYSSLYSSLAAMRAYGDLANTSVFLATRDGEVLILWLFHVSSKQPVSDFIIVQDGIGFGFMYLLVVCSFDFARRMLSPPVWRAVFNIGLEYIAYVFSTDFILNHLHDKAEMTILYWPFTLMLVGAALLRWTTGFWSLLTRAWDALRSPGAA